MDLQRNYYEVLGVPPTATTSEIKKKYHELARKFHPDIVRDKDMGQRLFSQINKAYHVLGNPERRTEYDTTLEAERVSRSTAAPVSSPGFAPATNVNARPNANGAATTFPNSTAPNGYSAQGISTPGYASASPLGPSQQAQVAHLLTDAENALMQGNAVQTQQLCRNILSIDERNDKAWTMLGDALAQAGKSGEAVNAYKRALQIVPSSMLQAKITRLESAPASGVSSGGARSDMNRTNPPGGAGGGGADKQGGGLFGKLFGQKK